MKVKRKMPKIVFAGGGTGGHAFTCDAVKESLQDQLEELDFCFIRGICDVPSRALLRSSRCLEVVSGKLRRYFSWHNFSDPFRLLIGVCQAFLWLKRNRPDVIFSGGGYASLPATLAGVLLGIPVILHEQTLGCGLANRIVGRFSGDVLLSWNDSRIFFSSKIRCREVGQPIRRVLSQHVTQKSQMDLKIPVLFVAGGSSGSFVLNRMLWTVLPELVSKTSIIHQTGRDDFEEAMRKRNALPISLQARYQPATFFDVLQLAKIYAKTNVFLGRSGALTVAELSVFQVPSIFVPLSNSARGEQLASASKIQEVGGACVLEEKDFLKKLLSPSCLAVICDRDLQRKMSNCLSLLREKHLRAADVTAHIILKYFSD